METPVRNNLLFGIMVFILGAVLLCVGIAAQPDREIHTGYVVLNNQQELDAFSTSVLLNGIERMDFSIKGSDFPYIVHLKHVLTEPNGDFAYGDIDPLRTWEPQMDKGLVGNFVLKLVGIGGILLGLSYIICMTLFPKWATNRPVFKTEWVPYKKKDSSETIS